ncbi:transmembrane protein 238, partial [Chelydra serpentina]
GVGAGGVGGAAGPGWAAIWGLPGAVRCAAALPLAALLAAVVRREPARGAGLRTAPGARSPLPGPRSSLLRLASKLSERLSQRRPPLPGPSPPAPGSLELRRLCAMESPGAHGDRLV